VLYEIQVRGQKHLSAGPYEPTDRGPIAVAHARSPCIANAAASQAVRTSDTGDSDVWLCKRRYREFSDMNAQVGAGRMAGGVMFGMRSTET